MHRFTTFHFPVEKNPSTTPILFSKYMNFLISGERLERGDTCHIGYLSRWSASWSGHEGVGLWGRLIFSLKGVGRVDGTPGVVGFGPDRYQTCFDP